MKYSHLVVVAYIGTIPFVSAVPVFVDVEATNQLPSAGLNLHQDLNKLPLSLHRRAQATQQGSKMQNLVDDVEEKESPATGQTFFTKESWDQSMPSSEVVSHDHFIDDGFGGQKIRSPSSRPPSRAASEMSDDTFLANTDFQYPYDLDTLEKYNFQPIPNPMHGNDFSHGSLPPPTSIQYPHPASSEGDKTEKVKRSARTKTRVTRYPPTTGLRRSQRKVPSVYSARKPYTADQISGGMNTQAYEQQDVGASQHDLFNVKKVLDYNQHDQIYDVLLFGQNGRQFVAAKDVEDNPLIREWKNTHQMKYSEEHSAQGSSTGEHEMRSK